ncbi:MAG: DNA repair protein RecO [Bacteroidia bacterium]
MYTVTEGILIKSTNYSESSLILKVFSEKEGIQSFIYRGAKKKNKHHILQPLSILSITYDDGKSELKTVKEISLEQPFINSYFDVLKSSLLMFLNEFLYKRLLVSNHQDVELYRYLKNKLVLLDNTKQSVANFHLYFLAHLTKLVGITPGGNPEGRYFQLVEGEISNHPIAPYLDSETTQALKQMLLCNDENFAEANIPKHIRMRLLNGLLDYFSIHLENKTEMKSLKVLTLVLGD